MTLDDILERTWSQLDEAQPQVVQFLEGMGVRAGHPGQRIAQAIDDLDEEHYETLGYDREQLLGQFAGYIEKIEVMSSSRFSAGVKRVTVIGGRDKSGQPEDLRFDLVSGQMTAIVGPTGSGKSRLLADIEWMAQGDTPTARRILIDGMPPDPQLRFSLEHRIVAQLSQNMNFVMDASVQQFVALHAESRMNSDGSVVSRIIELANDLAGERFSPNTPVTSLSGGQSRALMIADTALLSSSPIVLIDEIENAGIDRKRALELLADQNKIVLVATHDPILALMCQCRLVIRNGGIAAVLETSQEELACLDEIRRMDGLLQSVRNRLRFGQRIESLSGDFQDSRQSGSALSTK